MKGPCGLKAQAKPIGHVDVAQPANAAVPMPMKIARAAKIESPIGPLLSEQGLQLDTTLGRGFKGTGDCPGSERPMALSAASACVPCFYG
jgi:hypothetical protein